MFDALFGKKSAPPESRNAPAVAFDARGIRYASPVSTTRNWLAMPFAFPGAADLGARLAQIFMEGFGDQQETEFLLP